MLVVVVAAVLEVVVAAVKAVIVVGLEAIVVVGWWRRRLLFLFKNKEELNLDENGP
jgi:hypothetical protein